MQSAAVSFLHQVGIITAKVPVASEIIRTGVEKLHVARSLLKRDGDSGLDDKTDTEIEY